MPETPRPDDTAASEALESLPKLMEEVWEHLGGYLGAKWARSKGNVRDGLLVFALAALLVLLLSGVFLIAIAFACYGAALALGQWLGRPWAGYLLCGGVLLLSGFGYLRFKISALRRAALREKIAEYEQKLERQKEKYGLNALERAAAQD